jgi:hypothetical protein
MIQENIADFSKSFGLRWARCKKLGIEPGFVGEGTREGEGTRKPTERVMSALYLFFFLMH